jgi:hypothetical protein
VDIQDQNHGNVDKMPAPRQPEAEAFPVDNTRRRFSRAAARVCKSPSGSLSGGLQSQPSNQTLVCGGLSPGYWKQHLNRWPAGAIPKTQNGKIATKFASVFPGGGTTFLQNATLLECLEDNSPSNDPHNLAMHLVAAYLNVLSGKISYLTVPALQKIWHDVITYGYYSPSAGVKWDAYAVKIYLESTEG